MKKSIIVLLFIVSASNYMYSQDDTDDLTKAAANPLADLISLPIQNNLNMNYGPYSRNVNVTNIQPVIPLFKGKFITRTILPIVSIPDFAQESDTQSKGLADIVLTGFYVPESKGLMWGFGPVIELPTGGEERGSEKWSAGPSLVAISQHGDWTLGVLANNAWSFAGDSDREDVNHMLLNVFLVKQLGKGWNVSSTPIITADWNASKENRWIVPVGGGIGKLTMLGGKLPLNLSTQLYYNAVRPDFGPKWQWRAQAQFLLPTSLFKGKKKS